MLGLRLLVIHLVAGAALAVVLLTALAGAPQLATAAVVYTDRAAFEAALGGETLSVEDFDAVAVNGAGFAAVSNGAAFAGFTMTSLSLGADIDLTDGTPAADTGLDGTFLLRASGGDVLVLPGGGGSFNPGLPSDNDDFRIELDFPAKAAGLGLIENNDGPGAGDGSEWVRFLDAQGATIVETTVPISATLVEQFVGLITEPGDPPIAAIEVNEGNVQDDDIAFDDVEFTVAPLVPALHPVFGYGLLPLLLAAVCSIGWRRH